jgi:hypothetical protein
VSVAMSFITGLPDQSGSQPELEEVFRCEVASRFLIHTGSRIYARDDYVAKEPGGSRSLVFGRGRIECFFATLTQMFLCDLPGYVAPKGGMRGKPTITLPELA